MFDCIIHPFPDFVKGFLKFFYFLQNSSFKCEYVYFYYSAALSKRSNLANAKSAHAVYAQADIIIPKAEASTGAADLPEQA